MYGDYGYYGDFGNSYGGYNSSFQPANDWSQTAWLSTSQPLNLPVGPENPYAYFGGENLYFAQNANDYRDMLAMTGNLQGTPYYQLDPNFTPNWSPEVQQLLDKREAYQAMSPQEQQWAAMTGNGYFSNADMANLFQWGINDPIKNMQGDLGVWSDAYNDALAQARLDVDTNNMPDFGKQWAAEHLSNHTWSSNGIGEGTFVPAVGDQLGRTLLGMEHRGVLPSEALLQSANSIDALYNQIDPSGTWSALPLGHGPTSFGSGESVSVIPGEYKGAGVQWGDGTGELMDKLGYNWHAGTPYKNNSLAYTGGNGLGYGIGEIPGSILPYDPRPNTEAQPGQWNNIDDPRVAGWDYGRPHVSESELRGLIEQGGAGAEALLEALGYNKEVGNIINWQNRTHDADWRAQENRDYYGKVNQALPNGILNPGYYKNESWGSGGEPDPSPQPSPGGKGGITLGFESKNRPVSWDMAWPQFQSRMQAAGEYLLGDEPGKVQQGIQLGFESKDRPIPNSLAWPQFQSRLQAAGEHLFGGAEPAPNPQPGPQGPLAYSDAFTADYGAPWPHGEPRNDFAWANMPLDLGIFAASNFASPYADPNQLEGWLLGGPLFDPRDPRLRGIFD